MQPLWKTVWRFLKKLKTELPYDPATPLLGIYLKKTIIRKDTCTPMFIAALFTIAKTWKQPKCASSDEWIRKMWYIYTMEYYSAIKKWNNAICSNMDGPRDYHTKWSKSERERQGPSLVAHWLRIHLPMQGTRVRALVQEDPTCHGATKPMNHNYWACAL